MYLQAPNRGIQIEDESSTPVDSPPRGRCRPSSHFPARAKWYTCRSPPEYTSPAAALVHPAESHQQLHGRGRRLRDRSCNRYQRRSTLLHKCRRGLETCIARCHHRIRSRVFESSRCSLLAPRRLGLGLRLSSGRSDRRRRRDKGKCW